MKYLQTGGFQNQSLTRLTILFTLLFLTAFWVSNFAMFFAKMGSTPQSIADYYLGSEGAYTMPRTYQSMLEVTHGHLPMMAVVILLLTHLLIFAPYAFKTKVVLISTSFSLALIQEAAGWLVRFGSPAFAWLKLTAFLGFQAMLALLLVSLALFLLGNGMRNDRNKPESMSNGQGSQKKKNMRARA